MAVLEKTRKNSSYIAVWADKEVEEKIVEIAKSEYLTKSDILRRALRQFVDGYEKTV